MLRTVSNIWTYLDRRTGRKIVGRLTPPGSPLRWPLCGCARGSGAFASLPAALPRPRPAHGKQSPASGLAGAPLQSLPMRCPGLFPYPGPLPLPLWLQIARQSFRQNPYFLHGNMQSRRKCRPFSRTALQNGPAIRARAQSQSGRFRFQQSHLDPITQTVSNPW